MIMALKKSPSSAKRVRKFEETCSKTIRADNIVAKLKVGNLVKKNNTRLYLKYHHLKFKSRLQYRSITSTKNQIGVISKIPSKMNRCWRLMERHKNSDELV